MNALTEAQAAKRRERVAELNQAGDPVAPIADHLQINVASAHSMIHRMRRTGWTCPIDSAATTSAELDQPDHANASAAADQLSPAERLPTVKTNPDHEPSLSLAGPSLNRTAAPRGWTPHRVPQASLSRTRPRIPECTNSAGGWRS